MHIWLLLLLNYWASLKYKRPVCQFFMAIGHFMVWTQGWLVPSDCEMFLISIQPMKWQLVPSDCEMLLISFPANEMITCAIILYVLYFHSANEMATCISRLWGFLNFPLANEMTVCVARLWDVHNFHSANEIITCGYSACNIISFLLLPLLASVA